MGDAQCIGFDVSVYSLTKQTTAFSKWDTAMGGTDYDDFGKPYYTGDEWDANSNTDWWSLTLLRVITLVLSFGLPRLLGSLSSPQSPIKQITNCDLAYNQRD